MKATHIKPPVGIPVSTVSGSWLCSVLDTGLLLAHTGPLRSLHQMKQSTVQRAYKPSCPLGSAAIGKGRVLSPPPVLSCQQETVTGAAGESTDLVPSADSCRSTPSSEKKQAENMNGFAAVQTNADAAPSSLLHSFSPFIFLVTVSRAFLFDCLIMKFMKGWTERFSRRIISLTDDGYLGYFN